MAYLQGGPGPGPGNGRNTDGAARIRDRLAAGRAAIAARDYTGAEDTLAGALPAAETLDDPALVAEIRRGLLQCAFFSGNRAGALVHGIRALEPAERSGDARRFATAHNDLGLVHGSVGDHASALRHLLAGLEILRGAGETNLASLLNNIGNVYLESGDAAQALEFFRQAHEAFGAHQPGRGEAIALGNAGRALTALGQHAAARDAFERSLRGYEALDDVAYLAPATARLAGAHAALGDGDAARAHFDRSLALLDEGGGEFADEVLLAAGRFHLAHGRVEPAVSLLERALARLPGAERSQRVAEVHEALADAFERAGDPAAALGHFRAFHRVREAVADEAAAVRVRGLMLQFDVERARQREEIHRLKTVELAHANDELRRLHAELEARNRQLQQISVEDGLTGLHNRRYLDAQLEQEVARSARRRRPLSVAVCDLDHFKRINDELSHAVGDDVLRVVGHTFRVTVRQEDIVARFGGEEFVVILPETDLDGARVLAERLREAVAAHPWHLMHPALRVTMSIGLATLGPAATPEDLLALADARLYAAKRAGRDRVCH